MRIIRGKTALVTGAASGIGRAIALRLAEEGASLFLLDINMDGLEAVAAAARSHGVEARVCRCDLTSPSDVTAAVQQVLACWNGVDILVNNAGITYYGRTNLMSDENWRQLMAVNLLAPIQLTRELLPHMLKREEGHILNVASALGLIGLARVCAYSTSKFGIVGFTESLRAELARRGIGVSALCPGLVDTRLFTSAKHGKDYAKNVIPPGWLLTTPERIANHAIRAIRRNKGVVVIQLYARAAVMLKRLAPWLIDWCNTFKISRKKKPPAPFDRDKPAHVFTEGPAEPPRKVA
jgi:short-subunit dehydrogenase